MTWSGPRSHTTPSSAGRSASLGPAPEMEQQRDAVDASEDPSGVAANLVAVHSQTLPTMSARPQSLGGWRPTAAVRGPPYGPMRSAGRWPAQMFARGPPPDRPPPG